MTKQIEAKITLNKKLQQFLTGDLANKLVTERDMAETAAMIHYFILARTARGEYLNTGFNATYSEPYRVTRLKKKGYTNEQVTLSFSGAMLDALQTVVTHEQGMPVAMVGYFEGKTDPKIFDLAGFHNELGAGSNKVVREFIGLTSDERQKIVAFINKKIHKRLK